MIEQWFSIISEQLFEPSWREFYVEREVVQREWAFRYVNKPSGAAWLDLSATAYNAHPYRNPTIGWPSDMARFSTTDAIDFHKRYYNPADAVCVLVGDITVAQARRLAEIYFPRYPTGPRAPERVTAEPRQQGTRRSVRYLPGARTPLVRMGYHGAPMGSEDFYALDVATMLLSLGRSASITQDIVEKGLAVSAWAGNPDNRYGTLFVMGGTPNEPPGIKSTETDETTRRQAYVKACRQLENLIAGQVKRLQTDLVSPDDLARIKKLNRRDFLDRLRTNEALAGTLATLEVQIGWHYLLDYLKQIDRITAEQVRAAARRYLRPENRTSIYVIPGGKPATPPQQYSEIRNVGGAAAASLKKPASLENHSIYPTPKGWKHPLSFERHPERVRYPEATRWQSGDTTVFFLPDHELPLVELTLLVKAGRVDVPDDKAGLATLLNQCLIRGGTATHDPRAMALVLDRNAIRMSVDVGQEATAIRLSVLKGDWRKGLSLLREVLTAPALDTGVLKVAKSQEITALQRQGGNAQAVAFRELMIRHFKGHVYGRDPLAALQTIPQITREDMADFVHRYLVPANMVAAVAGDLDKADVRSSLDAFFKDLSNAPPPSRDLPLPAPTPPVLTVINKPGQVQSQVFLALPGLRRTQPGYWQNSLLMDIFGGSDSLMYTRLRDDLGLVYSAWFTQTYKWKAGLLVGYIGCKADKTALAIEETLKIMDSLRRRIPAQAFKQKRLDALNSFVFNVDTPQDLVVTYGRYFLRKEPLDTLERIQTAFIDATPEALKKLADKLLDPRKVQIVVVTDLSTPVQGPETTSTVGAALEKLAAREGLPYSEAPLR
jgi:predicted Zn-dependent peptidase